MSLSHLTRQRDTVLLWVTRQTTHSPPTANMTRKSICLQNEIKMFEIVTLILDLKIAADKTISLQGSCSSSFGVFIHIRQPTTLALVGIQYVNGSRTSESILDSMGCFQQKYSKMPLDIKG